MKCKATKEQKAASSALLQYARGLRPAKLNNRRIATRATTATTETSAEHGQRQLRPPMGIVGGALFGMASAVLYTLANIALRGSVEVDPFLVSAVKAVPTVVCLAPVVVWFLLSGQTLATSLRMLPRFAAVALVGQLVGNAAFQVALGGIGLAATVPITLGVLIVFGGIFGRLILGEPVRPRTIIAMITLIAAVVVLSLPASHETPSLKVDDPAGATQTSAAAVPVWLGALCAAASGAAYAMFGTVLRQTLNGGLSAPLTMFVSGVVGTITLWAVTLLRVEFDSLAAVDASQWLTMTMAGIFNFTAFVSLSMALKSLPVVAVNLINASQVAMAAVAGVILFSEPITVTLLLGISLTFAGLTILASRRRSRREPSG